MGGGIQRSCGTAVGLNQSALTVGQSRARILFSHVDLRSPVRNSSMELHMSPGPTTTALILVIEDYTDIALVLRMMLERRGYHVEVATTLQAAELLFATHSFDLII